MNKKKIVITHLTIRFYESDGWTEDEVRKYLVDKNTIIVKRECGDNNYFAVYERSGHKVFNQQLRYDCVFDDLHDDLNWYLQK